MHGSPSANPLVLNQSAEFDAASTALSFIMQRKLNAAKAITSSYLAFLNFPEGTGPNCPFGRDSMRE